MSASRPKLQQNPLDNRSRGSASRPRLWNEQFGRRPLLEILENRYLLTSTSFVAVIDGVPAAVDLLNQAEIGRRLLENSGVSAEQVQVTQALDLTGAFIVQTPTEMTVAALTSELQTVPGFAFAEEYANDGDPTYPQQESEDGGDLVAQAAYEERLQNFDYVAYTSQQDAGLIPSQAGAVTPDPAPADAVTNNNAGSSGASYYTQSETTLLAFGNTVVTGYNDSGSYATGGNKFTGFSYSTNGGASFTDGGVLPTNPNGDAGDPVLARNDNSGRIYLSTLQFSGSGVDVFHSDNNGVNWSAPAQGAPGKSGTQDKEWITVDNFSGPGDGNVYLVERDFGSGNGIYFFRSTDGGNTFGPYGGTYITSGDQGAFVAVGPDHSVDVFWWAGSSLMMRKSVNQGLSFAAPVIVASGLSGGVNGDLGLTGYNNGESFARAIRSNEFPHVAINPVNGDIYVTYDNNPSGTDKADVYIVESVDGGNTWSAPVRVNDDSTTTDQWQPTIAVTPDGSKLGIFYYSRQDDTTTADGDPVDNQFKYYGRIGTISGSTVSFASSFAVSDTPSKPEVGRDSVVNSTYMGDYNQAAATPDAFHVTWSDNRNDLPGGGTRKDPNVYYKTIQFGFDVTGATPAAGSTVTAPPTTFTVNVSDPIDPASLQASDFTVNGTPADAVSYVPGGTSITFEFNATPVTVQGLQTMQIAAGAFTRASDGDAVAAFNSNFRYDATLLAVASTVPPSANGVFTLPGPFEYDVMFNEDVAAASVQSGDLLLSGVAGATATLLGVSANTARFQISGMTSEGTLAVGIAAGTITDVYGNPNPAAFSASYAVDIGTAAYPTPLIAENPPGSEIYDPI
ncbi:MAG TPA: hypothetical protein VHC19_08230, partial [Pirellulales bacterium]|nr:hypothetical protein [Pirellulales bacterium]